MTFTVTVGAAGGAWVLAGLGAGGLGEGEAVAPGPVEASTEPFTASFAFGPTLAWVLLTTLHGRRGPASAQESAAIGLLRAQVQALASPGSPVAAPSRAIMLTLGWPT